MKSVCDEFGSIDIYLFDQIQKGRFSPDMKILDAGCGGGRNLVYFLKNGFDVSAVDQIPEAVEQVTALARTLAPNLSSENFRSTSIHDLSFSDSQFDWVISSAVLHFAENKTHFDSMLDEMWRVLKPGGTLFARLASSISIEGLIVATENGRYRLPDGSERYLVDESILLNLTERLRGQLIEPIKTTNVQNLRAMTTWVIGKNST